MVDMPPHIDRASQARFFYTVMQEGEDNGQRVRERFL